VEVSDVALGFEFQGDRSWRDDDINCPLGGPLYFFFEGVEQSGDDLSGFTRPRGIIDLNIVYRWEIYDPFEFEALRACHLRRGRVDLPHPGVQAAGNSS